jgi:RND family efflux transporter MFP subunit
MGSEPPSRKTHVAWSRTRDPGCIPHCNNHIQGIVGRLQRAAWGRNMTSFTRFAGVAIAILGLVGAGCSEGQPQQAKGPPPPPAVTVAKPVRKLVVDQDEYVGRFVAVESVEVRARVGGYLEQINFTDGQMVKQGDTLFVIDRRPYRHVLEQAKANLAQARANLAYAQSDLERGAQLVKDHTITQQLYDQRLQTKNVAEANVRAQEEAVATAELDHNFTELHAPITGRIGDRRVSTGNLVMGGLTGTPTLLATIVTVDPIRFEFTFDEAAYLRYERLAREGKDVTSREGSVIVAVKLIDEKDFVRQGRMDFVDNVIDKASGTIRGRAVFPNPDGVLTPGMFGRIRVPGTPPYLAMLVPEVAIGTEQARKFLLVVAPDGTVQQKFVTFGQAVGQMRVVKDGLAPDDRVVVNGLMRARPGQKVTPQEEDAPPVGPGRPSADASTTKTD